jgi:hypothetical protein
VFRDDSLMSETCLAHAIAARSRSLVAQVRERVCRGFL